VEQALETGVALAVAQRDMAQQEMHHRVFNHLQILASLVGLQARGHDDLKVREALFDVRRRILAIARIHGELQRAQDHGVVEISRFFQKLGEDLRLCFSVEEGANLRIDFDIEPGDAPIETAISLALITNELITNAMKYAVLPVGGGIDVELRRATDGAWRLTVRDEGPGLRTGSFQSEGELGFSLLHFLVRKHRGVLSVGRPARGAAISVSIY
jgi:two-component sensor histidine kinase